MKMFVVCMFLINVVFTKIICTSIFLLDERREERSKK